MKSRVSLVIPVYNEVDRIHDCLQAVSEQSVLPVEVFVVDNNSTDGTAAIAASFPFVTVLREPKQGVVYARDRGFNAARGDIIARIDADTLLPADWIAQLIAIFEDQEIDAVSGSVQYREIVAPRLISRIDLFWRRRMANVLGRDVALQGANMALRRTAWKSVATQVCHTRGQHEDFDLAVHLTQSGRLAVFAEDLQVSVCYRQADYDFKAFCEYALISPRTYLQHGVKSGRKMYQVVAFVILMYPIISTLSRGYDEELGRFSWRKLSDGSGAARVNPATYFD